MIKSKLLFFSHLNTNIFFSFGKATKKAYVANAPIYYLHDALKFAKVHAISNIQENIDIHIILNVDPKKGDQIVRGSCLMPSGLGKQKILAVNTSKENHELALKTGADIVLKSEDFEDIKKGVIKFDKLISTIGSINDLKPFAKILGPKGLMPNQKVGSLISEDKLEQSIKNAKMGEVQFRVDSGRSIHSPLGKLSFEDKKLYRNLQSLMEAISERKPATVKGSYLLAAYISSTRGEGFRVNVDDIDPRSKGYKLAALAKE